jgi:hypothetical protein|tara:strand:- start:89 stop:250 length:162 start_codon:yes stop_codon:yes gene_type:complete
MRKRSKRIIVPTLNTMTVIFRGRHYKRPKGCAKVYMMGFNDAKKRYKKNSKLK